ncbi:MAG: hypothetical protein JO171_10395 [Paludibacterium sp.]|uniref:hypothetical protein n=1 Tax=Paludibacterium sp. TaxID=1917523 RepID=UPI0025E3D76C|nr:hypothetical protein [Paludibacterium sp.]MBV8047556.1 hypothetical protein [Paludibacterium sp.]MBV8648523.1 hypothetical protein [Paludibacterium sp.]
MHIIDIQQLDKVSGGREYRERQSRKDASRERQARPNASGGRQTLPPGDGSKPKKN